MIDIAPLSRFQRETGPRVLVVEDDADIAGFVRAALEDAGYDVASARHGAAGLEVADRFCPDVVLVDLRMPIMDGWSFVKQYRARHGDGRVVLLSGVHEARDIARQVNADAVLEKPLEIDVLIDTVARLARG